MSIIGTHVHNTTLCQDSAKIVSGGLWRDSNPLLFSVPLILLQLTLVSIVSKFVEFCLRPLGQPAIVSQVLGGIVLGPSVLGNVPSLAESLFPLSGSIIMETIAAFGIALFVFSMGVKMDASLMFKPGRAAVSIALSMYFFTLILPITVSIILIGSIDMEGSLRKSLPLMVSSQSFAAFPAVAGLLAELKVANTEVGRVAMATAMFYTFLVANTIAIGITLEGIGERGIFMAIGGTGSIGVMATVIICVIKPLLKRFLLYDRDFIVDANHSAHNDHVTCIFVLLLVFIFVSEVIGQHYFLGPVILGLSIPGGSPVGGAVVSKIDTFVSILLYPTFLTISGLKTDLSTITIQDSWIVVIIVIIGVVGKMIAIMIPAVRHNISFHDALVLSLVLNARGLNELLVFNLAYDTRQINAQEFACMVMSIVLVTAVITPLIRILYDRSRHYRPVSRMTIQHAKNDTEIRIVVCIHQNQQDNVLTMINLLEASYASTYDPISVTALILVEIVGQSAPMLLAYRPHKTYEPSDSKNNIISNAFQQYERHNDRNVSVQVFTNKCHISAMHDDVCRVAIDKRASLVIIPFHKQWAIDGSIGSINKSIQSLNRNIIDWIPCSLGILIDRSPIKGRAQSMINTESVYRVGLLFIGGADDVESLAYGSRMARHDRVVVTVIRFLLLGHDSSRERKRDTDIVEEYRRANIGNENFIYREELVKDGVRVSEILRGMGDHYDLIMVGRNHQNSPLLFGLYEWSECPELGVIGDLLASPDAETTASVLVIQQQQKPVGKVSTNCCLIQNRSRYAEQDDMFFDKVSNARRSSAQSYDR